MAGKVNSSKLINELQRTMALKESGAERPYDTGKRHAGCDGHGCQPTCGYHGYCDFEATRYYTLVKDRLRYRLVKVNDTITIDAICDSDTIISVVEVPYEKIVYVEKETFWDKFKKL
jgi:hypothetical protein